MGGGCKSPLVHRSWQQPLLGASPTMWTLMQEGAIVESSLWLISTKTWPHPTAYKCPCWDASGQTTNWVGTQPYSSADRLPKDFLSLQPLLDMSLEMALPTRGSRSSSIHQWAGISLSLQEACSRSRSPYPTRGKTLDSRFL